MDTKKKVFVIMPFSDTKSHPEEYWTRHFIRFLKPIIEEDPRLQAYRSQPLRADVAHQIIRELATSDIVVADLTDYNPNVFWELGVRHTWKGSTIMIAEIGTRIPFHLSHKPTHFYNGDHLNGEEFKEGFKAALNNCIESPDDSDSPVLQALGGRGTFYNIIHTEENARRIEALFAEVKFNEQTMRRVYDSCEQNKQLRTEKKDARMTTILLRSSAAELLYVNRYLDLDAESYEWVDSYYTTVQAVNGILNDWRDNSEYSEQWLIEKKEIIEKVASQLKERLTKFQQKNISNDHA